MHLPDGILPLEQSIVYWIFTLIILAIYYYYLRKQEKKEQYAVSIALFSVLVTVLSSITIPSPLGVPMHFLVIPLVAILIGPLNASIVSLISLLFQSLFFGMGGIVCFGANFLVMGFIMALITYSFYNLLSRINEDYAIFLSTVMGIMLATFGQIIILLFSGAMNLNALLTTLVPFYLLISIIEGILNIIIIRIIPRIKPELLEMQKF